MAWSRKFRMRLIFTAALPALVARPFPRLRSAQRICAGSGSFAGKRAEVETPRRFGRRGKAATPPGDRNLPEQRPQSAGSAQEKVVNSILDLLNDSDWRAKSEGLKYAVPYLWGRPPEVELTEEAVEINSTLAAVSQMSDEELVRGLSVSGTA